MSDTQKAKRIAELNDQFRKEPTRYGRAYTTDGVAALGPIFIARALAATAAFDRFTEENDPHGEHDFGSFNLDGEKLFWKVDYYDKRDPDLGSEDPSDPAQTARVLTIMLASEYRAAMPPAHAPRSRGAPSFPLVLRRPMGGRR